VHFGAPALLHISESFDAVTSVIFVFRWDMRHLG
jgi:hypothetical protein